MNLSADLRAMRIASTRSTRTDRHPSVIDATSSTPRVETVELVLRLPDRWRETGRAAWASDSAFRVVRSLGPQWSDATLGDYEIASLVEGPIAAIVRRATGGMPAELPMFLTLSCVLDQIRNLLDAARSWAPGALYRVAIRVSPSPRSVRVEVDGSLNLEGRTFVPLELLERGADRGEPADDRRSGLLAAFVGGDASPGRIATKIAPSGSWRIEVELAHDDDVARR